MNSNHLQRSLHSIRPLQLEKDFNWTLRLWHQNDYILGIPFPLLDLKKKSNPNEIWLVMPTKGFIHYRKKPGCSYVLNLATDQALRGRGIGRKLINAVPKPIELKTEAGDKLSNGFYRNLGFREVEVVSSRKGRPQRVYRLEE